MCGIFGFVGKPDSANKANTKAFLKDLFLLSESRGKEASGLILKKKSTINFLKAPLPASEIIKLPEYKNKMEEFSNSKDSITFVGHSRLVTNGYEHENKNNQPILKKELLVVHNGIITNEKHLWAKRDQAQRQTALDSELIPEIISEHLAKGLDIGSSVLNFFEEIYGMTTFSMLSQNNEGLILGTNNGSLYYAQNSDKTSFVFASEKHILKELLAKHPSQGFTLKAVTQLKAMHMLLVDDSAQITCAKLKEGSQIINLYGAQKKSITEIPLGNITNHVINTSLSDDFENVPMEFLSTFENKIQEINAIQRCSCCILPASFPFIEFDEKGVCNYCNNRSPIVSLGNEPLKSLMNTFKSTDQSTDCLVPFSGGRDSCYALHYIKEELGMNPIAFSYDWGMLTDLGRRNQSRMCGALGVEHILISADIRKKRANIKKNVLAWLKKPNLGTIPLFMAGDKQYFYFANLLMKQNNLQMSLMGENMLETTFFKSGFCGIKPQFNSNHTYTVSTAGKLKMLGFYGLEFLKNPAYINSSLLDSLDAFKAYYIMEHKNVNLFDYLKWDEQEVNNTLIDNYHWETDPETSTTWRIGDGTTAFYNYIYYMVAGFTENDTFRSNQIREGQISREEALKKIESENQARWKSIQWYCNTIGIDWKMAIKVINNMKTIYQTE